MTTAVTCDRCGVDIGDPHHTQITKTVYSPIDLCAACTDELLEWVAAKKKDLSYNDVIDGQHVFMTRHWVDVAVKEWNQAPPRRRRHLIAQVIRAIQALADWRDSVTPGRTI